MTQEQLTELLQLDINDQANFDRIKEAILDIKSGLPSSTPTTLVVTIPSSASGAITYSDKRPNTVGGILSMGSSPIPLLPAPGANMYYDYTMKLEFLAGGTAYSAGIFNIKVGETLAFASIHKGLISGGDKVTFATMAQSIYNGADSGTYVSYPFSTNTAITMTTTSGANPTLGTGTMKITITYMTKTIGA